MFPHRAESFPNIRPSSHLQDRGLLFEFLHNLPNLLNYVKIKNPLNLSKVKF